MSLGLDVTLKKLKSYQNATFPILSVYLQIPKQKKNLEEELKNQFHHLVDHNLSLTEKSVFQTDIESIESELEHVKVLQNQKGLVFFTGGNKVFEQLTTPIPVSTACVTDHSPYLKPLEQEVEQFKRYLILLSDRARGRIFTIYMDNFEDEGKEVFEKSVAHKVKAKGNEGVQHHVHELLHKHLNLVCQKTQEYIGNKHIDGVIIGGHKDLIKQIGECLPSDLKQKIVGRMVTDINLPLSTLTDKANQLIQNTE